jgi:hypothetical protein
MFRRAPLLAFGVVLVAACKPASEPSPEPVKASECAIGVDCSTAVPVAPVPVPHAAPDGADPRRACKTTADCRVVKADPCDRCACATTPVNAAEATRLATVASEIECDTRKDQRVCGECRGAVADCQAGTCVSRPEP